MNDATLDERQQGDDNNDGDDDDAFTLAPAALIFRYLREGFVGSGFLHHLVEEGVSIGQFLEAIANPILRWRLGTVSKLSFGPISALGVRFQSSKYLSIPPVETSRPS